MGVLICLRESGLVGMGAMFGGDVIQSRSFYLILCAAHSICMLNVVCLFVFVVKGV